MTVANAPRSETLDAAIAIYAEFCAADCIELAVEYGLEHRLTLAQQLELAEIIKMAQPEPKLHALADWAQNNLGKVKA